MDLTSDNVAGTLDLRNGGSGLVLNGGAVSGTVKLGAWSGDATFSSVAFGKKIEAVTMSGTIEVTGAVTGSIETSGDVSGDITIGGDADAVVVAGTLSGDIDITGDCGTIDVDDGLVSVGRVLVGGEATGGITLGMAICPSALVRVVGGLASTGFIDMDTDKTNCIGLGGVGGDIQIGNGGSFIFDPSAYILVSDHQNPPGGNWDGDITVNGCLTEDPGPDLEICVCGTGTGATSISQPCVGIYAIPPAVCNDHCN